MDKEKEYYCGICGSCNIQILAWINPNRNEYVSDGPNTGECWCEDCDDFSPLEIEEKKNINNLKKL